MLHSFPSLGKSAVFATTLLFFAAGHGKDKEATKTGKALLPVPSYWEGTAWDPSGASAFWNSEKKTAPTSNHVESRKSPAPKPSPQPRTFTTDSPRSNPPTGK